MSKSRLTYLSTSLATSLATLLLFSSGCSAPGTDNPQGSGGSGATAGTTGSGGSTAGTTGSAGTGTGSGGNSSGGSSSTAGTTGGSSVAGTTGGSSVAGTTGGSSSGGTTGGSSSSRGGNTGSGGVAGGTGGSGSGGSTAGASGSGSGGSSGGAGGTGVRMDQGGIPLARPGDMTNVTKKYLNLGDMRLINNRWGSDAKNCTSTMQSVLINADKTFGYNFNRGACDSTHGSPDFPEVEFGVAPFGRTSSLLTTPAFSSTTLLPIQLSALTSASVNINNFVTSITSSNAYWDSNYEFWISKLNPLTNDNAQVYAEIIVFTGWQANRQSSSGGWPCMVSGTVPNTSLNLCHQSDNWASGWRFFNFLDGAASGTGSTTVNKTVDIKAIIDWIRSSQWGGGFTNDMWLTRIEVGTEVDENAKGSGKFNNLTFEINRQSRSAELAP